MRQAGRQAGRQAKAAVGEGEIGTHTPPLFLYIKFLHFIPPPFLGGRGTGDEDPDQRVDHAAGNTVVGCLAAAAAEGCRVGEGCVGVRKEIRGCKIYWGEKDIGDRMG